MNELKVVSYYRVSTAKQGKSGLGLDAQRKAVGDFLTGRGAVLIGEFLEIESGKIDRRPQLEAALSRCELTGATLVVAKLDRLSRNVAFLATLQGQWHELHVRRHAGGERAHDPHHGSRGSSGAKGNFKTHEGGIGGC